MKGHDGVRRQNYSYEPTIEECLKVTAVFYLYKMKNKNKNLSESRNNSILRDYFNY